MLGLLYVASVVGEYFFIDMGKLVSLMLSIYCMAYLWFVGAAPVHIHMTARAQCALAGLVCLGF